MLHPIPRTCLVWLPLVIACPRAGDAPAEHVEHGTSTATGPAEPPTSTPTTAETITAASSSTGNSPSAGDTATGGTSTSTSDASTSADASSTGDARPSSCGNAQLDPGEECDLGLVENSNSGACSIECKDAKCGDGLLQIGKGSCDNAGSNNNTLYGGCMQNCQFGPRCNDGKIQDEEECDLGDANGSGEFSPDGVPCDGGCRYAARLVFLSSVAYKGGEIGGVEGANTKCQLLADCKTWTSSNLNDASRVGRSGVDKIELPQAWDQWYDYRHWTNFANSPCEMKLRIYCVEQLSEPKP